MQDLPAATGSRPYGCSRPEARAGKLAAGSAGGSLETYETETYAEPHLQEASGSRLPAALLAGLISSASFALTAPDAVRAQEQAPPPQRPQATQTKEGPQTMEFRGNKSQNAPATKGNSDFQLPEGNQWRYSEFINAVQNGKVERVRFSKEGGQLQVRLELYSGVDLCETAARFALETGQAMYLT